MYINKCHFHFCSFVRNWSSVLRSSVINPMTQHWRELSPAETLVNLVNKVTRSPRSYFLKLHLQILFHHKIHSSKTILHKIGPVYSVTWSKHWISDHSLVLTPKDVHHGAKLPSTNIKPSLEQNAGGYLSCDYHNDIANLSVDTKICLSTPHTHWVVLRGTKLLLPFSCYYLVLLFPLINKDLTIFWSSIQLCQLFQSDRFSSSALNIYYGTAIKRYCGHIRQAHLTFSNFWQEWKRPWIWRVHRQV